MPISTRVEVGSAWPRSPKITANFGNTYVSRMVTDSPPTAVSRMGYVRAVGGLSVTILLTYVLPKFAVIFGDLGQALPTSTRVLLGISHSLRAYWWAFVLAGVGSWLGSRQYLATPQGRLAWDRWRLRLWVVGPLLRKREV